MPRQARLDAPGTQHHVILRGTWADGGRSRGPRKLPRASGCPSPIRRGSSGSPRRGLQKRSRERNDHKSTESTTSRIIPLEFRLTVPPAVGNVPPEVGFPRFLYPARPSPRSPARIGERAVPRPVSTFLSVGGRPRGGSAGVARDGQRASSVPSPREWVSCRGTGAATWPSQWPRGDSARGLEARCPGGWPRWFRCLPHGSRFYYPPGVPLSYDEPASGTTYCLSRLAGVYYVCGYSATASKPVSNS